MSMFRQRIGSVPSLKDRKVGIVHKQAMALPPVTSRRMRNIARAPATSPRLAQRCRCSRPHLEWTRSNCVARVRRLAAPKRPEGQAPRFSGGPARTVRGCGAYRERHSGRDQPDLPITLGAHAIQQIVVRRPMLLQAVAPSAQHARGTQQEGDEQAPKAALRQGTGGSSRIGHEPSRL